MELCAEDCGRPIKVKTRRLCNGCYQRWLRRCGAPAADSIICVVCQRPFKPLKAGRAKVCSAWTCQSARRNQRRRDGRAEPVRIACRVCSNVFDRRQRPNRAKTCSDLCRDESARRNRRKGRPPRNVAPVVNAHGYLRVGRRLHHRMLMEQLLGRPLLPNETVHHCNTIRTDNRIDGPLDAEFRSGNLQLWVSSQPSGGRVVDVLAHAIEIVERYAPELLRQEPVQLRIA